LTDALWDRIGEQFRAFVCATAVEELCRVWILAHARAGKSPLVPETVGRHWAQDVRMDVVTVNREERAILLGECRRGVDAVGRSNLRELLGKTPRVLQARP